MSDKKSFFENIIEKFIDNYIAKKGGEIKVNSICINRMTVPFNLWVYGEGHSIYVKKRRAEMSGNVLIIGKLKD